MYKEKVEKVEFFYTETICCYYLERNSIQTLFYCFCIFQAKLSKKLFIEALEANFQKENTDEKINLFKERECYEKSILEVKFY